MIQRLVAICIFLTISACASVQPEGIPVSDTEKSSVQKKGALGKPKPVRRQAVAAAPQIQRQEDLSDFDLYDDTPIEILPDEILIVGRIKLSPLLEPEKLEFEQEDMNALRDKAIMVRSIIKEPLPPEDALIAADTFKVSLDKDFLLTLPHSPVAILGGYVYIRGERGLVSAIELPGSWQLGIRPEDHAIYIGTIHYVRSEYDTILDYIVEDNYPQAYEAYQHRLEEGIILRKELVHNPRIN